MPPKKPTKQSVQDDEDEIDVDQSTGYIPQEQLQSAAIQQWVQASIGDAMNVFRKEMEIMKAELSSKLTPSSPPPSKSPTTKTSSASASANPKKEVDEEEGEDEEEEEEKEEENTAKPSKTATKLQTLPLILQLQTQSGDYGATKDSTDQIISQLASTHIRALPAIRAERNAQSHLPSHSHQIRNSHRHHNSTPNIHRHHRRSTISLRQSPKPCFRPSSHYHLQQSLA